MTVQMKAAEQYFPLVLLIMLYKVVLTFESVDDIYWVLPFKFYWAIFFCETLRFSIILF